MQEKHLYEYAVIRFLPAVEREEFLNVGIILFCKKAKYIKVLFHLNEEKLKCFSSETDFSLLKANLEAFSGIAEGKKNCGVIATYDLPERFRWLTAFRSSSVQTSRPHPGLCENLDQTTARLFKELVL